MTATRQLTAFVAIVFFYCQPTLARADVFALGSGITSLRFVPVGSPGNPNDPSTGNRNGAVNYLYQISKYETTNAQYAEFLNSKAADDFGANVLGLYNPLMGYDQRGGIYRSGSGTDGDPYVYSLRPKYANKPVTFLGVFDGMRFANWVANGQSAGDTESGSYELLGGSEIPSNAATVSRAPNAKVFIPNDDEWYKAAYYEPGASIDGYWRYGTRSDELPTQAVADADGNIANPGRNVANFGYGAFWDGLASFTTVGSAGPLSETFYGGSDFGGNQAEFTETRAENNPLDFIYRTGCWCDGAAFEAAAEFGVPFSATFQVDPAHGFRLAARIPEPGSILVVLGLAVCVPCQRVRVRAL